MKKILFLTFVFLVLNNKGYSQFTQNSWEAGLLINGGTVSTSDYISDPGNSAYFSINFLPAFYILNGLSVEPQFSMISTEDIKPEFNFIGNLSYTYLIKNSAIAPYISVGYGLSNSISLKKFITNPFGYSELANYYHSDEFDIGVFNSSVGMKFLVSKLIALRGELNFKEYHVDAEEIPKQSSNISQLSFLGGVSFLF